MGVVAAIVEGPADRAAVEVLLGRWLAQNGVTSCGFRLFEAGGQGGLLAPHDGARRLGVEYWVDRAASHRPAAILVLLDADDECETPKHRPLGEKNLARWLKRRAESHVRGIPISVVVADRCFETWLLHPRCQDALHAAGRLRHVDHGAGARVRGNGKALLSRLQGIAYSETTHQALLTRHFPLTDEMFDPPGSLHFLGRELRRLLTFL